MDKLFSFGPPVSLTGRRAQVLTIYLPIDHRGAGRTQQLQGVHRTVRPCTAASILMAVDSFVRK